MRVWIIVGLCLGVFMGVGQAQDQEQDRAHGFALAIRESSPNSTPKSTQNPSSMGAAHLFVESGGLPEARESSQEAPAESSQPASPANPSANPPTNPLATTLHTNPPANPPTANPPARSSAKRLLLLFSSKSCKPCHTLESNLAQIAPALESSFAFYNLNFYEKSHISLPLSSSPVSIRALRAQLGIIATPTLVAFDDSSPIFVYQGVLSVRELAYLLKLLQAIPLDLPTKEAKSQWVKSQLLAYSRATHAPESTPSISTPPISTQGQP